MLTAEAEVEQRVRGLRAGADDYLVKPFHPLELLARIKACWRGASRTHEAAGGAGRRSGRLCVFYGAKGGVGTTTIAINTAIALPRELTRRTALDRRATCSSATIRVFLDLGLDTASIVNAVSGRDLDVDLLQQAHGPPRLRRRPAARAAVARDRRAGQERQRHDPASLNSPHLARRSTTTRCIDIDKTLDDFNLRLFDAADVIFVVMTADLSCLKNVRLVLETMDSPRLRARQGPARPQSLECVHRHQRQERRAALERTIDHQIVNEYRGAISALNSGAPFMSSRADAPLARSITDFARAIDLELAAEPVAARA